MTENPHRFAKECDAVTQVFLPGLSALCQPVLTLVGEGRLGPGGSSPDGNIPEGFSKKKPDIWQHARKLAGDFHGAIAVAFPKPVDCHKVQPCSQKLDASVHDY